MTRPFFIFLFSSPATTNMIHVLILAFYSRAVHIYERSAAAATATDVECYLQFLWSVRASVWRNDIPLCVRRDFRLISRYSFLGGVPSITRRNQVSLRMFCCWENTFSQHMSGLIFWKPFFTNASTRVLVRTKPLQNCAKTFACWPSAFVFLGGSRPKWKKRKHACVSLTRCNCVGRRSTAAPSLWPVPGIVHSFVSIGIGPFYFRPIYFLLWR